MSDESFIGQREEGLDSSFRVCCAPSKTDADGGSTLNTRQIHPLHLHFPFHLLLPTVRPFATGIRDGSQKEGVGEEGATINT